MIRPDQLGSLALTDPKTGEALTISGPPFVHANGWFSFSAVNPHTGKTWRYTIIIQEGANRSAELLTVTASTLDGPSQQIEEKGTLVQSPKLLDHSVDSSI